MAAGARFKFTEVVSRTRVSDTELAVWIERAWVRPVRQADMDAEDRWMFSDADLARVELICDLVHEMAIDAGAVEVILPLLDQIYALRRDLRTLTRAMDTLPEDAREAVLQRIRGDAQ